MNQGTHPDFPGKVVLFTRESQPTGDDEAVTAQTIGRMIEYATADASAPAIIEAAREALREQNERAADKLDPAEIRDMWRAPRHVAAAAVWNWIRARVRFREDADAAALLSPRPPAPALAEVLIRPVDLIAMREPAGDCDDQSMLAVAMLAALGVSSHFKTVAADPEHPSEYSHVYVIADTERGPVALDCSHGPVPGWEVQTCGKERVWSMYGRNGNPSQMGNLDPSWWSYGETSQPAAGGGLPSWATDLFKLGAQTGATIATNRWGMPRPEPGTRITTPDMTVSREPTGFFADAGGSGFGTGGILLLVLGVGVAALAFRGGK